jgi:hypothetical protein
MVEEACSQIEDNDIESDCKLYEGGILLQGLRLGIIDHLERARYVLTLYNQTVEEDPKYYHDGDNLRDFYLSGSYVDLGMRVFFSLTHSLAFHKNSRDGTYLLKGAHNCAD